MSIFLHFFFLCSTTFFTTTYSLHQEPNNTNPCTPKCGNLQIPFPFHLNSTYYTSSCNKTSSFSEAFSLSCINSTSVLYLTIASQSYKILDFFPDGVLLDFPNATTTSSPCRRYNDLKSFQLSQNQYFGISSDNVLDLYDCDDSSLCKPDCEKTLISPSCDGGEQAGSGSYPSCCYPLSDRSFWGTSNDDRSFSDFSRFGCRGFSSWVVLPGSGNGKRGVKLEWGVPRNMSREGICAGNADAVNATSVVDGIRCQCRDGFVGDGFRAGLGCIKSCFKDGKEVEGIACDPKNHSRRKTTILAGVITSAFTAVSLTAIFCLLKRRPNSTDKFSSNQSHCPSSKSFKKASKSRLFTYHELEEATKGFDDRHIIVDGLMTKLYAGILTDGSQIAVQRIRCERERSLIQISYKVEALSVLFHKNMARILGWSVDPGYDSLVVYDFPENRTLKEHLHRARRNQTPPLDWYKRLNIAAETSNILAYLHEHSPPIFHNNLQSSFIFLDADFTVKLAGFQMHDEENPPHSNESSQQFRLNDVSSFGIVLIEIITGETNANFSTSAFLQKIKNGKLEEIVDPSLYYHEQPIHCREQIEIIADLATRCLLFGGQGKLGIVDVAKELAHVRRDCVSRRGPGLEETFSNSSLLQMISMSPDSIYLPRHD